MGYSFKWSSQRRLGGPSLGKDPSLPFTCHARRRCLLIGGCGRWARNLLLLCASAGEQRRPIYRGKKALARFPGWPAPQPPSRNLDAASVGVQRLGPVLRQAFVRTSVRDLSLAARSE